MKTWGEHIFNNKEPFLYGKLFANDSLSEFEWEHVQSLVNDSTTSINSSLSYLIERDEDGDIVDKELEYLCGWDGIKRAISEKNLVLCKAFYSEIMRRNKELLKESINILKKEIIEIEEFINS